MIRKLLALLTLGACLSTMSAAEPGIGSACPNFTNLPRAVRESGRRVTMSLGSFKNQDVLVLCVTCNHCPVAVLYEDRLINFAKQLDKKSVAFVAVNVNNNRLDGLEKMDVRAKEKSFPFPYLYDQSQVLGRSLGAKVTPHFFVFNKERKLIYHGAMDDSKVVRNKEKKRLELTPVKSTYVMDAVNAALAGKKPEVTHVMPFGCSVQYNSTN